MKKNNKPFITILSIALAFVVIGGVLMGVGLSQGGDIRLRQNYVGIFGFPSWDKDETSNEVHNYTVNSNVTKLTVEIDTADVDVVYGSEFKITTRHINKSEISFEENGNNATFVAKSRTWSTSNEKEVQLTIPSHVKDLDLSLDLGDLDITGGFNLSNLNVKVNAGDVDIENMMVETANIDLDLGDFDFSGDFTKAFTYDNNAGDSDINLRNLQSYYDLDVSGSLGSFEIGDQTLSSINGGYKQSNNTGRLLKVNVDLGDLTIEFMDMDD